MNIVNYKQLNHMQRRSVEDIFYATSSIQNFTHQKAKKDFQYKYLDYYHENFPEYFFIMIDTNANVLGYICCDPDTFANKSLYKWFPYYEQFKEELFDFPAHLHINLKPGITGKGLGSSLLMHLESFLSSKNIPAIHLFTTAQHRNVHFYIKNDYTKLVIKNINKAKLLALGKTLSD